jgi:YD repeat-containing protein
MTAVGPPGRLGPDRAGRDLSRAAEDSQKTPNRRAAQEAAFDLARHLLAERLRPPAGFVWNFSRDAAGRLLVRAMPLEQAPECAR